MRSNRQTIWNGYFILLCFISLFVGFGINIVNNVVPLFANSIGSPNWFIGMLSFLFAAAAAIGRIWSGQAADKMSRRAVMLIGAVIFAAGAVFFDIVPAVWLLLLALRALQGFGYSAASTASTALCADVVPAKRIGAGVGFFTLWQSLAQALGATMVLWLSSGGSYRPAFLAVGLCMALTFVASLPYGKKFTKSNNENAPAVEAPASGDYRGIHRFIEVKTLPLSLLQFLSSCAYASASFMLLLAAERGTQDAGLYFTLSAVGVLATRFFAGQLTDRFGALPVLLPALALGIAGYAAVWLSPSFGVYCVSGVLYGVSMGVAQLVLNAEAIRHAPPDRRGVASGTYFLAADAGYGLGSLLLGGVIDLTGTYASAYVTAAILLALTFVLSVPILKRSKRHSTSNI